MPQFDTTFFASQIFWTLISFAVLFVILSRWILPRIADALRHRTRLIEAQIKRAQHQRKLAERIKNRYEIKLATVDQETKAMFEESERRIVAHRHQLMAKWKQEMEHRKQAFREETEVVQQQAIREIRAQSADLIAAATEQMIHRKVGQEEAQQIVDEVIESLEKR